MDALHRVRITSLIHQTKLNLKHFINIAGLLSCKNLNPIHSYLYIDVFNLLQDDIKLWEMSKLIARGLNLSMTL